MNPAVLSDPETRVRLISRAEYARMASVGLFQRERVELIRGVIVSMTPIGPSHASAVDRLNRRLVLALGERARVRIQNPYAAADDSEPEPDVAVVPEGEYDDDHPTRAHLVVEVSQDSLGYDRRVKGPLYAESRVNEYWIVNLADQCIEVHREPRDGRYVTQFTVTAGASLSPLDFPEVVIPVAEIVR